MFNQKRKLIAASIITLIIFLSSCSVLGKLDSRTFSDYLINSFFDFSYVTINYLPIEFSEYEGKVVLIVNVASKCKYTYQYGLLQELYEKYNEQGFEILAFPCNQFGNQEFDNLTLIRDFVQNEYNVTFTIFEPVDVIGENRSELFIFLINSFAERQNLYDIQWNFEKFLLDKQGNVYARYDSVTEPNEIEPDIIELLGRE